jgi:hypothetical protein
MVDEMELLSRAKDAAPLRAGAFEEARTKLRTAMAVDAHPEAQPRQVRGSRPRKLAWDTRGKVGVGITAVAAAAVAAVLVGVTSSPAPSHPAASHPASGPGTRLAAWTVTRQANGDIEVSFFGELRDPAGLQRTLRADGVPASVTFIGQQDPACRVIPGRVLNGKPQQPAALNRVLFEPPQKGPKPAHEKVSSQVDAMVIHPSALPSGDGLQIAVMRGIPLGPSGPWPYSKGSGHPVVEVGLVKASPQCTGS